MDEVAAVEEVPAADVAEEMADSAAWRASTVLSTTLQCSLYIPLTCLQHVMQVPMLSRIW